MYSGWLSKIQGEICTSQEAHRLGSGGRKMQVPPQLAESAILGVEGGGQCCSLDIVSLLTALNTHLNLLNSTLLQEEKDFFLTLLFLCSRSVQRGHREENILLGQTDLQLFKHLQAVRV